VAGLAAVVLAVAAGAFALTRGGGEAGTADAPGPAAQDRRAPLPKAATPPPAAPAPGPTEGEVRSFLDRYQQLYSGEDADGLGSLFAADAVRRSEGVAESGSEAIATYREQFSNLTDPSYTLEDVKIETHPRGATVSARYRISSTSGTVGGDITYELVEQGDELLIKQLDITPA
jgi:hypothetical protein